MYQLWYTPCMSEPGDHRPILSVVFYVTAAGTSRFATGCSGCQVMTGAWSVSTSRRRSTVWPLGCRSSASSSRVCGRFRSHIGDGIARVLFTVTGDTMVLLHGFVKKSEKTQR